MMPCIFYQVIKFISVPTLTINYPIKELARNYIERHFRRWLKVWLKEKEKVRKQPA